MLIRKQRLERGFQAMEAQDVDMWIAAGNDLMHSGEPMLSYLLTYAMGGPVVVVLTRDGRSFAINAPLHYEELSSMGLFTEVIENTAGYQGAKEIISDLVRRAAPQHIALNYSEKDATSDGLSFTWQKILMQAFQAAGFDGEVLSSQNLMKHLRAQRSVEEVELIRMAVQTSMEIYEEARPFVKQGMSGMDIQRLFQGIADRQGVGYSWPKYGNPFNSIGTRSSYLCKRPADDVFIEPGDVVNVDFGIIVDGASSDNQRTFYALHQGETKPPEEVQHAFDALREVNNALALHMKAGVRAGDILPYANELFVKNGYPERQGGFGHEIGFYAHDGVLSPGSSRGEPDIDSTFLEGMTFTLEPAIITSHGRVCREEVVVVREDRGEILSTLQDHIWLIEP